ncbi:PREDICTED: translation initiation factor IF-2-like, partial [Chinchilla lanigera]|uniref:translation initiation factor IF-2-like n=1 Tax=Chinchilla lanigera TaxID=34839 RepID=UPI0006962B4C
PPRPAPPAARRPPALGPAAPHPGSRPHIRSSGSNSGLGATGRSGSGAKAERAGRDVRTRARRRPAPAGRFLPELKEAPQARREPKTSRGGPGKRGRLPRFTALRVPNSAPVGLTSRHLLNSLITWVQQGPRAGRTSRTCPGHCRNPGHGDPGRLGCLGSRPASWELPASLDRCHLWGTTCGQHSEAHQLLFVNETFGW